MKLRVKKESSTGLNTMFVNEESGRTFSLNHVINQIERGNKNYENYHVVHMSNGTNYVRSNADGRKNNNIEGGC